MTEQSSHFEQMLMEHSHLNELLTRMGACLDQRDQERQAIVALAEELMGKVQDHFDHEENEGFFDQIGERAPWLQNRAESLKEQHPLLAESLDELAAGLQRGDASEQWWNDAAERFAGFMEQFRLHEEDEHRLIQEAFDRDVAAED